MKRVCKVPTNTAGSEQIAVLTAIVITVTSDLDSPSP